MPTSTFFQRVNSQRLIDRSCESLIGICRGLLADEELNEKEVRYLDVWLADCAAISSCWPGNVIHGRVREILRDGRVSRDELLHLTNVLVQLIGGTLEESGAASGLSARIGFDAGKIAFEGRSFCFSGTFLFGTRKRCEQAVEDRGGLVRERIVRGLDYLVVGGVATSTWANSSFGRKIEIAQRLRQEGSRIAVVDEDSFSSAVATAPQRCASSA